MRIGLYPFLAACSILPLLTSSARSDDILVSAAASLVDAMKEIGAAYTRAHPGTRVRFNFASSGALLQQIRQGAPVDVFASASPKEMDTLSRQGSIEAATRVNFAGNRLVLITSVRSRLKGWDDLKSASVRRVSLSDPASVPSGRYARETLTQRNLWPTVRRKAVLGQDVRQTLAYVTAGDVDAGIVFATDARREKERVRIVADAIPGKDHQPIVYPAAVLSRAPHAPEARRFVQFLRSPVAQAILARYGFTPVPGKGSTR